MLHLAQGREARKDDASVGLGWEESKTGFIALLNPNALASRQPQYLPEHRLLSFLGKKICHFIHDFHPNWIARLGLPDSNEQLVHHLQQRILRRIQPLRDPFSDLFWCISARCTRRGGGGVHGPTMHNGHSTSPS